MVVFFDNDFGRVLNLDIVVNFCGLIDSCNRRLKMKFRKYIFFWDVVG